jgi:hypothetical protein
LSFLNSNFQAINSLIIASKSSQTVPAFGFGIRPFGHRTFATFHIFLIIAGVAMATSNSILPEATISSKSSHPATDAPAASNAFSFPLSSKAQILTDFPDPFGRVTVDLII